jgi:ribonuclease VapC
LGDERQVFADVAEEEERGVAADTALAGPGISGVAAVALLADAAKRPFTADQAELARQAWRRFGKGNHPAGLNLGDCCAYALAKTSGEPLLCKGNDFVQTDIRCCHSEAP